MSPLVSIITVSLNAVATVEDTIASVAMQVLDFELEHLCVDGGSVDGTRQVIDRWATRFDRIRRLYEPDAGIYDAMNKGLRAARGEYVLFLNADDFLADETVLATALKHFVSGSDCNPDLIVGNVLMGEPGSRGIWRRRRVPRLLGKLRGIGLFPIHQGIFARRLLLESVGGFDRTLKLASDVNLYYDLERRFRLSMRIIDSDVAFMRKGGSANAGAKAMWLGTAEIYRHLSKSHGTVRAAAMVLVKTMQSACEVRYGRCPQDRWFASTRGGQASTASSRVRDTVRVRT